ncbi:MAG: 3-deoxy-manno-octulosonate cytidylyltransferase [Bacteroidetes bacterium]|nr:3-deoxy-manno-octulosonate cytidylyltransferase [Bacteroidota bacterium]
MRFIGVIPARYQSSRFPGKPLADIQGKTMIQRVYEQSKKALKHVLVATDDERILTTVHQFGGYAVMTSFDHKSGTDRCLEALEKAEKEHGAFDGLINIQGDEPFIQPEQLQKLMGCFEDEPTDIATLVKRIEHPDTIFDPNRPKVVLNANMEAVYFSRSPIPYVRNYDKQDWLSHGTFYQHIGLYAYRSDVLKSVTKLPPSSLELAESLEQLRWIENGFRIKVAITEFESKCVDTMEDLEKILLALKK